MSTLRRADGEFEVRCTCGAMWTHDKRATLDQMESIQESHLKYFTRKPMETL